jgi:hypothetical protein
MFYMNLMGRTFSKKWLILGLSLLMIPLFQNMSPLGEDFFDIRERAPRRPAGAWDSPLASYFPKDMNSTSLGGVEQDLLSHNFDPLLKDLEMTYLRKPEKQELSPSQAFPNSENASALGQWRVGLLSPTKLRFSYDHLTPGSQFAVTCEAQAGGDGVALKMSKPFTEKLSVGLSHETGLRQSQIQMNYTW